MRLADISSQNIKSVTVTNTKSIRRNGTESRKMEIVRQGDYRKKVINIKCSWCGTVTVVDSISPDKTKSKVDYSFYCPYCKAIRYVRRKDIDKHSDNR